MQLFSIIVLVRVFAMSVDLDFALDCIAKEDPSLRVTTDPDTGQVCGGWGQWVEQLAVGGWGSWGAAGGAVGRTVGEVIGGAVDGQQLGTVDRTVGGWQKKKSVRGSGRGGMGGARRSDKICICCLCIYTSRYIQ